MTQQQLFSINRVQSIAAADRQEVSELAARLIDDLEHEKDIKNQLSVCIDKLTTAAEAGQLSLLSRHIREIGLMVLNTDAQHSLQLACLLLQTVDQLAECSELNELEIEQQLSPLLNEFKQSLMDYSDNELNISADSIFVGKNQHESVKYLVGNFDEEMSIEAANDFPQFDVEEDDIDLEKDVVDINMDIEEQIEMIDLALDGADVEVPSDLRPPVQNPDQDIDSLLDEINDFPDLELEGDQGLDDFLSSYIGQLQESQTELNRLACDMTSAQGDELLTIKAHYSSLLSDLSVTAEALELTGVVFVCQFIEKNLQQLNQVETDTGYLLGNWITPVCAHLQDPTDDQACLAVCEYLEQDGWIEKLSYRQQRELLAGLTQTAEMSGDVQVDVREIEITPDAVSLHIAEDANDELVQAFMIEAPDHAEKFSLMIDQLTRTKDAQKIHDIIVSAQRIAHTIKGSSHLLGIQGTANVAHQLEDILECLDLHAIIPGTNLCNDLVRASDELQAMMDFLQSKAPAPVDSESVLGSLIGWAQLVDQGDFAALSASEEEVLPDQEPISQTVLTNLAPANVKSDFDSSLAEMIITTDQKVDDISATEKANLLPEETIRVSRSLLDDIFNLVGETSIAIEQMQEQLKRLGFTSREIVKQDQMLQLRRFDLENAVSVKGLSMKQSKNTLPGSEDFDSLELDHYDEFYGVAHSFIEVVNDSRTAMKGLSQDIKMLDNLALGQRRLNSELQELVISTRLEPVKSLSSRLQRCVRQACRMSVKSAELVIVGEHMMMDGDMLKQLADPLMHILRNAVDHGIESEEHRQKSGKNPQGKITLEFRQQGSQIVVRCMDDGRGLDYAAIRRKAIANGILSETDQVDDKLLSRFILKSGFSTRDVANQLSGRGIGMDVVYNTINNLKGTMDVGNNATGGACVTLKLPVTLLTNHSLLVGTRSGRYAIPSTYLEQILSPGLGSVMNMAGKLCYRLKEEIYSLMSLDELITGFSSDQDLSNSTILLVQGDTEKVAIAIDKAIASSELVVKSLGKYVQHINSVSGMSLLGDGSLVAVLNLPYLLTQFQSGSRGEKIVIDNTETNQSAKVLIVDDSLSVRSSLSQLMLDAGYQPVVARDGIEAMDMIEREHPQMILTDLEMPRMNGLELASYIRKSEHKNLPIIMITSRNMQKHRSQAMQIGINQYLTKPFEEDTLISAIQMQLEQLKNAG
jgi:chemotaxis protein histidine kinase CheA/ActR/RegA family two-component response regulator